MSQRRAVLVGVGVPLLLVVALIVWGTARSGGESGRPGVNETLGEAPLTVEAFADFELTTLDGETVRLSDMRGKVVMVDFWSSWCAPCRAEGPLLASAYREWRERGVEFIGVAIWDTEAEVRSFVARNGIEYTNGIDPQGRIAIDFGVRGIPEKFFVMPDGEIVRKVIGPNTANSLDGILTELTTRAAGASAPFS